MVKHQLKIQLKPKELLTMRYIYLLLLAVVIGIALLFILQNPRLTTVSLFSASLTFPLSLLMLLTYIWGILTGGIVISLLRTLLRGVAKKEN
jgi:uncharacterized integral membrane protein